MRGGIHAPPPAANDDGTVGSDDDTGGGDHATMIDHRDAAMTLAEGTACIALRLDPARYRRLRLACLASGRGAAAILSEALDAWLDGAGAGNPPAAISDDRLLEPWGQRT